MHARAHPCSHARTARGLLVSPPLSACMQAAARIHGAGRAWLPRCRRVGPRLAVPALSGCPAPPCARQATSSCRQSAAPRDIPPRRAPRAAGSRTPGRCPRRTRRACARPRSAWPAWRSATGSPTRPRRRAGALTLPCPRPYPFAWGKAGSGAEAGSPAWAGNGCRVGGPPCRRMCRASTARDAAAALRRASGQQRTEQLPPGACGRFVQSCMARTAPATCRPY